MRTSSLAAGGLILAAGLLGCEREPEALNVVPLDQVPPAALKAAREKLPGVNFDAAWLETEGDRTAYEIRGRTREGRIRDAKVTPGGEVLEVD